MANREETKKTLGTDLKYIYLNMIQKIKLSLKLLQGSKHFEQLVKSTETREVSHRRNS